MSKAMRAAIGGSVGGQAQLLLMGRQLAQGIGDLVEQISGARLARTRRRHNPIGTIQAQAISAALRDAAGPANRAGPIFTRMNEQPPGRHGKIQGEPPVGLLVSQNKWAVTFAYRTSGAKLKHTGSFR